MENLSFNEICEMSIRQINALFRKNDESRLYPVLGRFNATERAIRRIRRYRRMGMEVTLATSIISLWKTKFQKS